MADTWRADQGRLERQATLGAERSKSADARVRQAVPVVEPSRQQKPRLGITVFVQADEPVESEVGDLWFDVDEPV